MSYHWTRKCDLKALKYDHLRDTFTPKTEFNAVT